jgi:hypothetical protein
VLQTATSSALTFSRDGAVPVAFTRKMKNPDGSQHRKQDLTHPHELDLHCGSETCDEILQMTAETRSSFFFQLSLFLQTPLKTHTIL